MIFLIFQILNNFDVEHVINILLLIVIIDENVDFVMKLSMKLKDEPFVVVINFLVHTDFRKVHKERRLQGPFQTKQIIGMLFLGWFFHFIHLPFLNNQRPQVDLIQPNHFSFKLIYINTDDHL